MTLNPQLMASASIYIVQVGIDSDVFFQGPEGEPLRRQLRYGELLEESHPGSRMTLVILTPRRDARPFQIGHVEFQPLVVRNWGFGRIIVWVRLWRRLLTLHAKLSIDVVTTQTVHDEAWLVLLFGRLKRVPVVGQMHYDVFSPAAQEDLSRNWLVGAVRSALIKRFLPAFASVRVVGNRIAATIAERGLNGNVLVLPVMVPLMNRANPSGAQRKPVVLFVGRLCSQKNMYEWLRVCARVTRQLPAAGFEVLGDGPLRPELERRARELGITVRFYGFVPNQELSTWYSTAGVFLLTSRSEGFGRVLVEAYAHGLPVVATRITGVEDIVLHGLTGYLHDLGDTDGMAESVLALLRDPSLACRMGQLGEAHVQEHFDPDRLAGAWVGLLAELALRAHA